MAQTVPEKIIGLSSGKQVMLHLIAYSDAEYGTATGDEFKTMMNPSKLDLKSVTKNKPAKVKGNSAADTQFQGTEPVKLTLEFFLDATGLAETTGDLKLEKNGPKDVVGQVELFKKVAVTVIGEAHTPPYVKIGWGGFLYKGKLDTFDLAYTLFHPSGIPLRATIKAQFTGAIDKNFQVQKLGLSSPDLTHVRVVKNGDTLPHMTKAIYGDPSHYLEVARVNNLTHFRDLTPGSEIYFPPIATAVS